MKKLNLELTEAEWDMLHIIFLDLNTNQDIKDQKKHIKTELILFDDKNIINSIFLKLFK